MRTLEQLEREVDLIKERNQRVELDKSWETCWIRRIIIATLTYLSIALYLWAIRTPNPWLNAIMPSVGFLLSTLTLPVFKDLWLKGRK